MGVRWVSLGASGAVGWLLDIEGEGEGFVELKRVAVVEREVVGRKWIGIRCQGERREARKG